MTPGYFTDTCQVRHADRLAAAMLTGAPKDTIRHVLGPRLMDETFEFVEVDITLERVLEGRVMRLVDDDVVEYPLVQLLMYPVEGKYMFPAICWPGFIRHCEMIFSAPRPWCAGMTCS